jgi:hypothetical protein
VLKKAPKKAAHRAAFFGDMLKKFVNLGNILTLENSATTFKKLP